MKIKILHFADIILGYAFRGAIEENSKGNVFLIQAKNITEGKNVETIEGLTRISFDGTRTASFLEKKDILIVSRGTGAGSFRSTVSDMNQSNVMASSSLIIVRIKGPDIIPEYVVLYLNSSEGQNKIIEAVGGSYIKAISRKKFEELEIPIPPLIQQKNLVGLSQNIIRQEHIYNRKKELKQNLIKATLKNLIHS